MKTPSPALRPIRFAILSSALLALSILTPTAALAIKLSAEITPDNLEGSGFTIKTQKRDDGLIEFILTRDLAKARTFPPDSDLHTVRSATLQVFDKSGLLAQCDVVPLARENTLIYRVRLAPECIARSHFTIAEIDDYKEPGREGLLGGGTFFEFRLGLFAEKPSPKTP